MSARFWKKVDITTKCWNWIGGLTPNGYGQFNLDKRKYYAHRFVYELTYGPIPEDKCVCHKCDNRRCVNPAHLFLGTRADNQDDMARKCRNGRKIDEVTVKAIRDAEGECRDVAKQFGVSKSLVSLIKRREVWKYA